MADYQVEVVVQLAGADVLTGRMWSHRARGNESATFSYATDYLARRDAYELDPLLPLSAGQQQTPAERATFGAFSDSAPDRWGRRLIQRAERRRARHDHETERRFGEIDYLVGVRDDLRQGALRFRDPETGGYLADDRAGIPQLVALPKLLSAAERVERDEADDADIDALLHGGSSLGGARPKAHVLDATGRFAIAKFPSPANDDWDVMRWEAVALTLARRAGIVVPDFALHTIEEKAVLIRLPAHQHSGLVAVAGVRHQPGPPARREVLEHGDRLRLHRRPYRHLGRCGGVLSSRPRRHPRRPTRRRGLSRSVADDRSEAGARRLSARAAGAGVRARAVRGRRQGISTSLTAIGSVRSAT